MPRFFWVEMGLAGSLGSDLSGGAVFLDRARDRFAWGVSGSEIGSENLMISRSHESIEIPFG